VIAAGALVAVAIPAAQLRAKIAALESRDDTQVLAALAGLQPGDLERPAVRDHVAKLFVGRSAAVQVAAAELAREAGSLTIAREALGGGDVRDGAETAIGQLVAATYPAEELAELLYQVSPILRAGSLGSADEPPKTIVRAIEIAALSASREHDEALARVVVRWAANESKPATATLLEVLRKRGHVLPPSDLAKLLDDPRPELVSAALEALSSKADPATLERLATLACSRAYSADEESLRERAALAFARAGDAAQVTSLALHSSAGASRLAGATRRADKTDPALEPLARGGLDALFELCSSKVPGRGDAVAATSLILRGAAGRLEPPERARVLPADARSKTLTAVVEWTKIAPDTYWAEAARALGPAVRVLDEDLTVSAKLADDPQPRLRFLGLDALVRGKGKEATPFLDRLSRDPVQAIRLQAAIRDAWVGRQEAIPRLIELTSDLDREIAEQARLNLELLLGDIESGPGLTERARTLWEQKKTRLVIQPIYPEMPGAPGSALVPR
jgi:hypothetical protein